MAQDPAVIFGKQMTKGVGADAVDRLSRDVFSRLSQQGMYRDAKGTWQIRGMERSDPSLQIRDSAVSAMGGPELLSRVRGADTAAAGPYGTAGSAKPSPPVTSMSSPRSGPMVPSGSNQRSTLNQSKPSPGQPGTQTLTGPAAQVPQLSTLGQRISGTVNQRVQQSAPQQSSPQTIQQVVDSRLRQQGVQPPARQTGQPKPSPAGQPGDPVYGRNIGQPTQPGNPVFGRPSIGSGTRMPTSIPGGAPQGSFIDENWDQLLTAKPWPTSPESQIWRETENRIYGNPAVTQLPNTGTSQPGYVGQPGKLGSYGNQTIDQWDDAFIAAGTKYGVDPTLLKAMMEIESGGNGNLSLDDCRYNDGTGIPSCGPMQIKPDIWGRVASVPEQIEQAAKILADGVNSGQYATHRDALFGIYFPGNDPNGTTQGSYGARVDELQRQMGPYTPGGPGTGGTPSTIPPTQGGPGTGGIPAGQPPVDGPWFPGANMPIPGHGTPFPGFPGSNVIIPGHGPSMGQQPPGPTSGIPGQVTPGQVPPNVNIIKPPDTGTLPLNPVQPVITLNNNPSLRTQWGPNTEPVITENQSTVGWMDLLAPGLSATYLADPNAYGFKEDQGIAMYCDYWDWSCTAHTGIDIGTNGSTQFNSLVSGKVVCTGAGSNQADTTRSGYSCGSYEDVGGGIGNLTVETPDGAMVTYGHTRSSMYGVGQQVQAGQPLGMSGNNNGYHTHIEVRLPIAPDGGYVLVDPNAYFGGYYCDKGYCPF